MNYEQDTIIINTKKNQISFPLCEILYCDVLEPIDNNEEICKTSNHPFDNVEIRVKDTKFFNGQVILMQESDSDDSLIKIWKKYNNTKVKEISINYINYYKNIPHIVLNNGVLFKISFINSCIFPFLSELKIDKIDVKSISIFSKLLNRTMNIYE